MRTKANLIFIFIAVVAGLAETASSKFLEYDLYKYNGLMISNSLSRVSMSQSNLPEIEVTKLDDVKRSSVGLLPPTVTGFPTSLWKESQAGDLVRLLHNLGSPSSPAVQKLLFQMLLAEAEAPLATDSAEEFLSERISILIEAGAIDPAIALLERASPLPPKLVPKLFEA